MDKRSELLSLLKERIEDSNVANKYCRRLKYPEEVQNGIDYLVSHPNSDVNEINYKFYEIIKHRL